MSRFVGRTDVEVAWVELNSKMMDPVMAQVSGVCTQGRGGLHPFPRQNSSLPSVDILFNLFVPD